MAVGTIALGEDSILHAGTTSTPADPISDIESYSRTINRPLTTRAVFMRENAHQFRGAREVTLTLNGMRSVGDTGQGHLITGEVDGEDVYIKLLPDGTNGKTAPYRIASRGLDGVADGPTEVSFDCALNGDEADEGTGEL